MKKHDYCEKSIEILQLRGYSERTIEAYSSVISSFFEWIDVPPTKVNATHFEKFFLNFKSDSVSKKNQVINAMKFLYLQVLKKKAKRVDFRRPRAEKKLPRVVDHSSIIDRINRIENIKHKAIISLAYSVGLRVSEVINLKLLDIDSDRMVIHVRNAKGRKDRLVPLSTEVLIILREYYKRYQPNTYLFNGQKGLRYSATSCRKIVKKYIGNIRFHDLRHSCITHLVESDVAPAKIAMMVGHSNTRTVERYTHLSTKILGSIPLPL